MTCHEDKNKKSTLKKPQKHRNTERIKPTLKKYSMFNKQTRRCTRRTHEPRPYPVNNFSREPHLAIELESANSHVSELGEELGASTRVAPHRCVCPCQAIAQSHHRTPSLTSSRITLSEATPLPRPAQCPHRIKLPLQNSPFSLYLYLYPLPSITPVLRPIPPRQATPREPLHLIPTHHHHRPIPRLQPRLVPLEIPSTPSN